MVEIAGWPLPHNLIAYHAERPISGDTGGMAAFLPPTRRIGLTSLFPLTPLPGDAESS